MSIIANYKYLSPHYHSQQIILNVCIPKNYFFPVSPPEKRCFLKRFFYISIISTFKPQDILFFSTEVTNC